MVRLSEIGARVHALCSCVHFLSEKCEVSTAKAMGSSRNRTQVLCMSAVPLMTSNCCREAGSFGNRKAFQTAVAAFLAAEEMRPQVSALLSLRVAELSVVADGALACFFTEDGVVLSEESSFCFGCRRI